MGLGAGLSTHLESRYWAFWNPWDLKNGKLSGLISISYFFKHGTPYSAVELHDLKFLN